MFCGIVPDGVRSTRTRSRSLRIATECLPGSINPNLFQDQEYKYGSFGNPDKAVRQRALQHTKDSIEIAQRLRSRDLSLWFADGSNYPGTANIRQRKQWFKECLKEAHDELSPEQRMLIEYKPFEPAFYHTDIADWGMALLLARAAGPQAKVLVDTGPSLCGAEYRADCRLAFVGGHARRLSLQRSTLRG